MKSAKDLVGALTAAAADVDAGECGPKQDCYDRIKISLFFDGTGNNKDADESARKWSNVARLFDAARDEPGKGIYARYISGIGTKLNRDEGWWAVHKYLRDGDIGAGTGAGAGARLESGDLLMNDRLKHALKIAADKAGKETKAVFQRNEAKGMDDLAKALSKHRLIKSIEVSVFGFSRGAALARAFVNRLLKRCKKVNDQLTYQGYPITFKFLGLFDTVASMGAPGKNDFLDVDLWLPKQLQQCVHYVAAHEYRYAFPVDLIRQKGGYPAGWKEEVFPGTHSDVGGGYTPTEQARTNSLGRVPLCAMFREASLSGVRLFDWKFVSTNADLKPKFLIPKSTQQAYDAYVAAVGSAGQSGKVEQRIKAHLKPYFAYKRTVAGANTQSADEKVYAAAAQAHRHRISQLQAEYSKLPVKKVFTMQGLQTVKSARHLQLEQQVRSEQRKLDELRNGKAQVAGGEATMADEAALLRERQQAGQPLTISKVDRAGVRMFSTTAEKWMLDAYYGTAPNASVVAFFDTLVHDSKAAFLGGAEPWSYFRKRGVWESATVAERAKARAERLSRIPAGA